MERVSTIIGTSGSLKAQVEYLKKLNPNLHAREVGYKYPVPVHSRNEWSVSGGFAVPYRRGSASNLLQMEKERLFAGNKVSKGCRSEKTYSRHSQAAS